MKKQLLLTLLLLLAIATQAQNRQPQQIEGRLRLTVHYLYAADNSMAAQDYQIDTMSAGQKYAIPSPTIEGYHPDRDTVKGRMPESDWEETVRYSLNQCQLTLEAQPTQGGTLSGAGSYNPQTEVTVTATPNDGYVFLYWTEEDDEVCDSTSYTFYICYDTKLVAHFAMMLPTVGDIEAPQGICSGESLVLTPPTVAYAERQGWELAEDEQFANAIIYENQPLDATYNGWRLRYFATNAAGTVCSNIVRIKVFDMEPELTGDAHLCSMETGTYTANNVSGADLTWTVSDPEATITESNKTLTVKWVKAGQQTVTLLADNSQTGCSATVMMNVTVQSFINESDIQTIVAKKNNGKDYILIYPNPKDTYKYQWYKNGTPIAGAKGQYYYQAEALDPGVYKAYISFNVDENGNLICGAFTDEYTVTDPATISLCPNPSHTDHGIQIVNADGGELDVNIYSIDGRLLHHQTVNGSQNILNVALPKGIYLVKFTDGDMMETTQKLIIE